MLGNDTIYRVGVICNLQTTMRGNPHVIAKVIKKAKKERLDLLVGPEWSLTAPKLPKDSTKYTIPVREYLSTNRGRFAAKDALEYFTQPVLQRHTQLPYSGRETTRILKILCEESRGSETLIMPGTIMVYTKAKKLYNVLPVIYNGHIIYSVFKYWDGGSTCFDLGGTLKYNDDEFKRSLIKRLNGVFYHKGLKFGVEICADSGLLKKTYKVSDLDIQILSAAGNSQTINVTNENGYVICADSCCNTQYIQRGLDKIAPVKYSRNMKIYEIDMASSKKTPGI